MSELDESTQLTAAPPPLPYRLVIFDFDGTLADSAPWFREVFNDVAERYGFRRVDADEIEELRALGNREIMRRLGVPAWKLPFIARHMRGLARASAHRIGLFPGIDAMLRSLHERGARIALVTSNAEDTVRQVMGLALAGVVDHFECGVSLFGKAPRLRRVLRRSGIPASEAIFIGDETRDIEAARQAGVAGAAVLWGYASAAAFDGCSPAQTFGSIEQMARYLIR